MDNSPITFSSDELDRMRQYRLHQFKQRTINLLNSHFPERVASHTPASIDALVENAIDVAPKYGIKSEQLVCQFSALYLLLGADFEQQPKYRFLVEVLEEGSTVPQQRLERVFEQIASQDSPVSQSKAVEI